LRPQHVMVCRYYFRQVGSYQSKVKVKNGS
jgi:hypothetical protein